MNLTELHQDESCVHSSISCLGISLGANVLLFMSVILVVTLTVCGNLLVITSICHFKQLHTPTNFLLLHLAMADFLVGVIVMPLYFPMLTDPQGCFDTIYCTTFHTTSLCLTFASVYNVALIAVDRCFAIHNPFQYSMKMTVNVIMRIICIVWLASLIYNMSLLYFNRNIPELKENITCVECAVQLNETWAIVDCIITLIVPCLTIIIMYLKIFYIAKNHAKKICCAQKCTKTNIASEASERKAAKALGVLVSVFLLCLVPFYICAFLAAYINNKSLHIAASNMLTVVLLNSAINPIIYALFYPWFQRCVKLIFMFRIFRAGSSDLNVLATK